MSEIFDKSVTFRDLGLRDSVCKGVEALGFEHPTDIQARLVPLILAGRDVIGQARTGTGKTAAFGLPILHSGDPNVPMQALILVPTRELAAQVTSELDDLGRFTPIRATCIIGGESIRDQVKSVRGGGHILVGTPGRIMDLQGRRQISFDHIRYVVLDEVDRMLDIGFREDIRKILKAIRGQRQTVLVSATISGEIERLARQYMKPDVEKVITISGALTVSLVDQTHIPVEPWDKQALLLHMLRREKPETAVVFCRTKATVARVTRYLSKHGIEARQIHGDLPQRKRSSVMNSLREGKVNVLVASDLAARGLDVEHISHVVNYDLPEDPEVYVHRIGRTARVGRRGVAWAFVTPEQGQLLTEIEKLAGVIIERHADVEFVPGPVPEDVRAERQRGAVKRVDPMQRLAERAATSDPTAGLTPQEIAARFPGGVIPQGRPKRTLGSRLGSRRRR